MRLTGVLRDREGDEVFDPGLPGVDSVLRDQRLAGRIFRAGGVQRTGDEAADGGAVEEAEPARVEEAEDVAAQVGVAGRVVFARNSGKLCFATLQDGDGTQLQAMISLAGVARYPSRIKCALLGWHALMHALDGKP